MRRDQQDPLVAQRKEVRALDIEVLPIALLVDDAQVAASASGRRPRLVKKDGSTTAAPVVNVAAAHHVGVAALSEEERIAPLRRLQPTVRIDREHWVARRHATSGSARRLPAMAIHCCGNSWPMLV